MPELQALVQIFCPKNVSPNCVVPTLSGLDFFLLPHFVDGLLQSGGTERMTTERDAWFRSPMCFIRDGPSCLNNLRHRQQLGIDLLASLDTQAAGDDELGVSVKMEQEAAGPLLGFTRRHVANDQARRAGGLGSPPKLTSAAEVVSGQDRRREPRNTSRSRAASADEISDLSDTDQEDQTDRRGRAIRGPGKRKHLLSPSVARSRVLYVSRHSTAKRIRTESLKDVDDKLSITTMPEPSETKVLPESNFKLFACRAGLTDSSQAARCAIPPSKYLVDGQHLAALMAVGQIPPSPS